MKFTIAVVSCSIAALSAAYDLNNEVYNAISDQVYAYEGAVAQKEEMANAQYELNEALVIQLEQMAEEIQELKNFQFDAQSWIDQLYGDIDENSNKIKGLETDIYFLNGAKVVKDHFWINDAGYLVEPEHCFEEIEVEAWQTFDF